VLHFGVFAILGVGMAWLSASFTAPPRLLLSLVFGVLLQEVTFYVGLLLLHAPHLGFIAWPHVFGANIAAGLVLMGYLHYAERDPRPLGLTTLRNHPLLARGVVNGLIGAAVVAVWSFVLDLASGHPFRTPAALGSALLLGASGPGEVVVTFGLVAVYTVVHVAAFVVAGVVFVALAEQVERVPAVALLVLLTAILLEDSSWLRSAWEPNGSWEPWVGCRWRSRMPWPWLQWDGRSGARIRRCSAGCWRSIHSFAFR